jgi:hypothetical protein
MKPILMEKFTLDLVTHVKYGILFEQLYLSYWRRGINVIIKNFTYMNDLDCSITFIIVVEGNVHNAQFILENKDTYI